MNHTLVKYKLKNLLPLIHRLINNYLIEKYDYPKEIDEEFSPKLCQKGLIIDKRYGNILKLDSNYRIMSAKHGNRDLTIDQINQNYNHLCNHFKRIPQFLNKGTINKETDFDVLKDYFTTPCAQIMAKIVEVFDEKNLAKDYHKIWSNICEILGLMYDKNAFMLRTGGFFQELESNPNKYLEKTSEDSKQLLESLRKTGKLVFLITSSNIDFTRFLMNYCFGNEWMSYFDCVLTYARKPTFFTSDRYFVSIDSNDNIQTTVKFDEIKCGQIYCEGNWNDLKRFVAKQTSKEEPKCVYIGDSFNDDCIVPNKYVNCDTIAIVKELEELVRDELSPHHWQSFFADDSNNTTLWHDFLKKHSLLMVPNLDALNIHYNYY
jgi:HAD superfamily 5'-nucleotidase-like hydrolase